MDGVLYVNDSKATDVSAAARAIESFFSGVHLRRRPQGRRLQRAARAGRGALPSLLPDRRGGRPCWPPTWATRVCRSTAAVTSRAPWRPLARPPSRARSCCSHRRAPRTTSSATTRSAGRFRRLVSACMNRARGVEESPDGRARRPQLETGRVLGPIYTATLCLLAFGAVMVYSASSAESAAQRPRRPVLPQALPDVRGDGPGGHASRLAARSEGDQGPRAVPADPLFGLSAGGDRRRGYHQRGHALARRGPAAVPALGAVEGLDRPLRGAVAGDATARDEDLQGAREPAADRGGLPAAARPATWGRRWWSALAIGTLYAAAAAAHDLRSTASARAHRRPARATGARG